VLIEVVSSRKAQEVEILKLERRELNLEQQELNLERRELNLMAQVVS
jgi:hypothetical protein